MSPRTALTLVTTPSRFDSHRAEVAEVSTLQLAGALAERCRDHAERVQALLATAAGVHPDKRAEPKKQALASAVAAHGLLAEIIGELQ